MKLFNTVPSDAKIRDNTKLNMLLLSSDIRLGCESIYYAAVETNSASFVSPNWLLGTYLVLTFGELLLSPIGISFVSKVAPPKYKGMMMGGWFVATALGNKLVSIPGHMWGMDLSIVWGTLMVICLIAALFIFSVIKKLNKVA